MFKCQECGRITQPREKQTKKVIAERERTYHYIDGKGREQISKGKEITKEINICEKCANK